MIDCIRRYLNTVDFQWVWSLCSESRRLYHGKFDKIINKIRFSMIFQPSGLICFRYHSISDRALFRLKLSKINENLFSLLLLRGSDALVVRWWYWTSFQSRIMAGLWSVQRWSYALYKTERTFTYIWYCNHQVHQWCSVPKGLVSIFVRSRRAFLLWDYHRQLSVFHGFYPIIKRSCGCFSFGHSDEDLDRMLFPESLGDGIRTMVVYWPEAHISTNQGCSVEHHLNRIIAIIYRSNICFYRGSTWSPHRLGSIPLSTQHIRVSNPGSIPLVIQVISINNYIWVIIVCILPAFRTGSVVVCGL